MEDIEESDIEESDKNMLVRSDWDAQCRDFLAYIETEERTIENIVRHHLSLPGEQPCIVARQCEWLRGTFNLCVPISVTDQQPRRLLIRCPLPHRFSTARAPHLAEEKLRTEAASYAWISRNCARVPIPILRGVGLPNGLCFTPSDEFQSERHVPEQTLAQNQPVDSTWHPFTPSYSTYTLKTGYLLMDFIGNNDGDTLKHKGPPPTADTRRTLLQSLAAIMLDIGRPMDRIGAFTVHDSGEVTLDNRPLTSALAILENDGIPTISGSSCDTNTISYFTELLDCHDSRLEHQPNAASNEYEVAGQMAVVVMLRALLPCFTQRHQRRGPFVFQLTDLNPGNIFIDKNYRITAICDLEWSCSLPLEMLHPPFWLSGHVLDHFLDEENEERGIYEEQFEQVCKDFAEAVTAEHLNMKFASPIDRNTLISCLEKKSHWYFAALRNPHAAYNIFNALLQHLFAPEQLKGQKCIDFQEIAAPYWCRNSPSFIRRKVDERMSYVTLLRARHQQSLSEL